MKRMMLVLAAVVLPVALFAQEAVAVVKEIAVPEAARNILNTLAGTWIGKTATVSVWVVTMSQIAKKLAGMMGGDLGGKYGKWVVAATTTLAGLCAVVEDGKVTPGDWVTVVLSVAGGVAAYFGYKLVFKQASSTPAG